MILLALHQWVLILFCPFLVVGGLLVMSVISWPDLIVGLLGERPPRQTSTGWAVATWA
jgi:hypothetical protein